MPEDKLRLLQGKMILREIRDAGVQVSRDDCEILLSPASAVTEAMHLAVKLHHDWLLITLLLEEDDVGRIHQGHRDVLERAAARRAEHHATDVAKAKPASDGPAAQDPALA